MPITLADVGQIGQDIIESLKNRQNIGKKGQKRHINTGWTQSKTKNLILGFLLSRRLRVRIPPRSQKPPEKQGFFHGNRNEPNLKYTKSMPITLARIGQSGQCECANTLFLDGMDEEIKNGWDEAAA